MTAQRGMNWPQVATGVQQNAVSIPIFWAPKELKSALSIAATAPYSLEPRPKQGGGVTAPDQPRLINTDGQF